MQSSMADLTGISRAASVALTILILTACAPPGQQVITVYDPVPAQLPPAPPARFPEPQPVIPRVDFDTEDGLPVPVNAACMSAVGESAGDFNVRVLGNETTVGGTEVTIGVGEDLTRWRCVASPTGEIVEVSEAGISG